MLSVASMLCRLWRCGTCGIVGRRPPERRAAREPGANQADDLTVIRGIGMAGQNRLHAAGIKTYAQLADATPADVRKALGRLAGRANVEEWIVQARALARQG